MAAAAGVIFKIYVLIKPTEERILYRTLDAALRAAAGQVGSEVEEWHAVEDSDRLICHRIWEYRLSGSLISGLVMQQQQ